MILTKFSDFPVPRTKRFRLTAFSIFFVVMLFPLFSYCQDTNSALVSEKNHTIAEWENQEAIWVIWPADTAIQKVLLKVIHVFSEDVPVNVVVTTDSIRDYAFLEFKKDNINFSRIKTITNPNAKGFMRDIGPWFIFDSKNHPARTGFKWNNFGSPVYLTPGISAKDSASMGKFSHELTSKMKLNIISSNLVIENGMLEINSKGVAIGFMETILQRNPSFTLPEITAELNKVLGLKKIIWLGSSPTMEKIYAGPKSANIFGCGANGHIDQYVRFANDTTILISQIDPIERKYDPVSSADYSILKENLEYLKNMTDDQDRPFHIIEIPVPAMRFYMAEDTVFDISTDTIMFKGFENGTAIYHAPMVSYLNFFICNNTVILPEYYNGNLTESEKKKDDQVGQIFTELFPDKKIVRVNPVPLNLKGGGIRRAFLSQPAGIQYQMEPKK